MNTTVRNLIGAGIIATSVVTAGQFLGSNTIEQAKDHIVKSYDLLTQYDAKKSELESKIKELTTELNNANADKESLQAQIDILTSEKATLEAEIERLNAIIDSNGDLGAELTEANRQIDIANNKVKELETILADKDLSQFNPNGDNNKEYTLVLTPGKSTYLEVGDLSITATSDVINGIDGHRLALYNKNNSDTLSIGTSDGMGPSTKTINPNTTWNSYTYPGNIPKYTYFRLINTGQLIKIEYRK